MTIARQPPRRTPKRSPVRSPAILTLILIVIATALIANVLARPSAAQLPTTLYPIGVPDASEPSGVAPPSLTALPGYLRTYVNDFTSSRFPAGWLPFTGTPGGDPGAQFGASHISFKNGELILTASRDPAYKNRWVTGGLCQCKLASLYGAYFVRSRIDGAGPNEVELLWPHNNQWPPEIDFNESYWPHQTSATVHWSVANYQQQWLKGGIDMLAWHTWGVIWSKDQIRYILDGHVWGIITAKNEIPRIPMNLDIEQRTGCTHHVQCPHAPVHFQIDWVAEYRAT